jgi:hypothetical protein
MATDSFVEDTLVAAFKTLSLIKSKTVNGKTAYNYSEINKTFDKANWMAEGWYELDIIPGEPYQAELGTAGRNRWVGIFQITVCVPLNSGKTMANARYEALAALFPRGSFFSGIEITSVHRCPNLSSEQEGPATDHYRLPVRIAYRADLEN